MATATKSVESVEHKLNQFSARLDQVIAENKELRFENAYLKAELAKATHPLRAKVDLEKYPRHGARWNPQEHDRVWYLYNKRLSDGTVEALDVTAEDVEPVALEMGRPVKALQSMNSKLRKGYRELSYWNDFYARVAPPAPKKRTRKAV